MTGNEFIRKLKAPGKKAPYHRLAQSSSGKGRHQTLYFGALFSIIRNPKDELKTGTRHGTCSQLGIELNDL